MGGIFSRDEPDGPNPTFAFMDERRRAEEEAEEARRHAADANAEMFRFMQTMQESQQRTMDAHMAAMQAATAAQAQAHEEMMAMMRAERAANEARFQAEAAARAAADEETKQKAAEAEEMRKWAFDILEETRKEAQTAAEQATKFAEAANEEKRKATAAEEAANASRTAAEEEVKRANEAKEDAERKLKEGIQPVVTPTREEVTIAKRRVQYHEDLFHFAVAGVAGGGKSSLINALCGLRNKDYGAAATGITETTLTLGRYADSNAEYPYVWYDIPGAGTLKIPDWQYFNVQGLYVFDCIIVLFDNRFTMTDIAILTNCRRFKIPTYIVRSKADQHIRNLMLDNADDSDDEDEDRQKRLYQIARLKFIEQTRRSVKDNLENANMPDQRVYIISKDTMLGVVKYKRPKKVIDEIELLNDLIGEAHTRRARRDAEAAIMKDKRGM